MWKLREIFLTTLAVMSVVQHTVAECNKCQPNGLACVSSTQFQVCVNDQPMTTRNFTCPNNQECTNTAILCFEPGIFDLGCGDVSACDICEAPGVFTCTSRTTFKLCMDSEPAGDDIRCPVGQLCDPELAKNGNVPCTMVCSDENLKICDRDFPGDEEVTTPTITPTTPTITPSTPTITPSTPTITPSTPTITPSTPTITPSTPTITPSTPTVTPTTTETTPTTVTTETTTTRFTPTPDPNQTARTTCVQNGIAGRYRNSLDSTCTTFINCYPTSTGWTGVIVNCPVGRFFSESTRTCQTTRPAGCSV